MAMNQGLKLLWKGKDERTNKDSNEHTGTGQRETQTISTHEGKWGAGGHNRESGKTIRLATHEKGQVT